MQPPLKGSDWLASAEKEELIRLILQGSEALSAEHQQAWHGIMLPLNRLDDAEVAAVLTHVRGQYTDQNLAIAAEIVAAIRSEVNP